MQRRTFLKASAALAALGAGTAHIGMAMAATDNPLLAPWTGPYGGAPNFAAVRLEDFQPAIEAAIALQRADIAAIADAKAPPTFTNTIAALEDAGRAFDRAVTIFSIYSSTMNSPEMRKIESAVRPQLAAVADEIAQNEKLFLRIKTVYDARETATLTDEEKRLVWLVYRRFARKGAALGQDGKARMREINLRLAKLYTDFGQNILADEENQWLALGPNDLDGLPGWLVAGAAETAKAHKQDGAWLIANTRSAMEPFLTYSTRRDLREKAHTLWASRGDAPGAHDNNPIIIEILRLRAERASLLGYPSFAHWVTDNQMAKTPDAAMALMMMVWKPAVLRAKEEVADMQKVADAEGAKITIAPWDYRFYAEKVRKAKFDLDDNAIKPYLQLEKMREAMHWAAGRLYGLEFKPIADLSVYHPDVRVYEVTRAGKHIGLWYFDPYARAGKRSGAWCSGYRGQERFKGEVATITSNNTNFMKSADGKPVLISWDDAETLFHEFGHALHGLLQNVTYPSLGGSVRDFIEFPSQINEHWLPTQDVLSRFALHFETGAPMPEALVAKIKKAHTFNQGFATVEYLASGILDMKLHLIAGSNIDPRGFEKSALAELGMPAEIVMRHRLPHFAHIFASEGYAAGYYDYIWADVLVADAAEAFAEAPGGFYDKALATKLHDCIISRGNSVDAGEAYRRFRGRDATAAALMRDRGFPVPA